MAPIGTPHPQPPEPVEEQRDAGVAFVWSLVYFPLLAGSVGVVIVQVYARMTMQRRWRAWLTTHLLDRWLAHGRYFQLDLIGGDHKNPEYRIADDVRLATEAPIEFAIGLTNAVLLAPSSAPRFCSRL